MLKKSFIYSSIFLVLQMVTFTSIQGEVLNSVSTSFKEDSLKVSTLLDSCWGKRTSSPSEALALGVKALKLIEEKDITSLKTKTLNYLGIVHRKLGNLEKSFEYFKYALNLAKVLKDSVQIGYTYNNLSDYYLKKASYSIALENVLMAYQIFEKLNHQIGMAYSLNYMGEIYIRHKDFEKAVFYLDEAAKIRKNINDLRGYSNTLTNFGQVYFNMNNYEKAREYYVESLKINKEIKYEKGISIILSLLGDILIEEKIYDRALNSIHASLKIDEKIENKFGIINNSNKLGVIYLLTNKNQLAYKYFKEALSLSIDSKNLDQEMISYLNLSKLYSAQRNYKDALSSLDKYITIKDSIYSYENMGKFADLQTLFATNKKELENEILKKDIEFDKKILNYFIVIFFISLFFIVVLVSKYKIQNKANNLLKELNSSKDKFFAILAHDLKNPFQGLLGYTDLLKNEYESLEKEEIKQSISSLHSVTRNVYNLLEGLLEWSRAQTGRIEYNPILFTLSEEAKLVGSLLGENAKRKMISLNVEIDDTVKVFADRNMVNTIFRNLVANAIKFTNNDGKIRLYAKKEKKEVLVFVEDTGIGMSPDEIASLFRIDIHHTTLGTKGEEGTGVGLILCKELVESNKGKIWVESELGKGSKFIFSLPSSKI